MHPLELAERCGASVTLIDRRERWRLMQLWRETFARPVKEKTGRWVYHGLDWHTFSWKFCKSKSGFRAVIEYLSEKAKTVYVVSQDETQTAFSCASETPIDFSECGTDVYVFPEDYAWTIAFTHEEPQIGPFFSRAEWATQGDG
jgi:hypothetical protein